MINRIALIILSVLSLAIGTFLVLLLTAEISLSEFSWWPTNKDIENFAYSPLAAALGVVLALLCVVGGLWLIIRNCRPYRVGEVEAIVPAALQPTGPFAELGGDIHINLGNIAKAAADNFILDGVSGAKVAVSQRPHVDEVPTATFTIQAEPGADLAQIRSMTALTEARLRAAVGDTPLRILFKLHF
ncbi:MAG: hypothetical protein Q3972_00600 [Corynebacterium sp.]|nr:hypothetical protein [Corynebacterium sp.]